MTFELSSALAAGDQKTVAEITRPVAKGFEGTPVSNLPYVMGLLANQCLQSENEGTTNANFLARYMANEVDFAVRDMNAAAAARDTGSMKAAYAGVVNYIEAYVTLLNMVIPPKVGEKFMGVLATVARQEAAAAAPAPAAAAGDDPPPSSPASASV